MGRYQDKQARKNRKPYMLVDELYIGDANTKLVSNGSGTYKIISPSSNISVDIAGNINISGSTAVTIGGKNLDFSELPDRYIRPAGISWDWVRNNTEVMGVIPIRIKGVKVYIPFIDLEV